MRRETEETDDTDVLAAARAGNDDAFARLVAPHTRPLHLHCYRMLGLAA
jgi:RNA polymerase sigma-70 factor (ECF subfamily)